MNRQKFPAKREDGTFVIEIGLALHQQMDGINVRVKNWIASEWMPNNRVWKREWRTGGNLAVTSEQILYYENEFTGVPEIIQGDGAVLRIRVIGKATAKFWRDWLISRLLTDLKAEFGEIGGQLYIKDCQN